MDGRVHGGTCRVRLSQKKMTAAYRVSIVTFALVFLSSAGVALAPLVEGGKDGCSAARTAWEDHELGVHMVPDSPLPGL